MSERPTAELARAVSEVCGWSDRVEAHAVCREAADRLAELDEAVETLQQALEAQAAIGADLACVAFDALRPPCPTCGGTQDGEPVTEVDQWGEPCTSCLPCPDCVDGKVSVEQMAATWRAVWSEPLSIHSGGTLALLVKHLRSVKPTESG